MQFSTTLRLGLVLALLGGATAAHAQSPNGPARKRYLFAQKNPECPVVANLTKNTDEDADVTGSYTHVCYRSPEEMLAEITELRKIHDWADSTYQRRLAALPPGVLSRARCYVAAWCPQERVLRHPAVGCFVTHNGSSSTLDALATGVPVVCWPRFADGYTISKYACEVWGSAWTPR